MADFKLVGAEGNAPQTMLATIASATVVAAGDLVEIDTGLIVTATATGAKVAFAPKGSADGETEIEITVGNDFILEGTSDAAFAVTDKGILCDLVGTTTMLIDIGTSSTDVLQIDASQDAGTAGETTGVRFRINKPIF